VTDRPAAVTGLTRRRGDVLALDDVTLSFGPGALHVLAGPNGSGKTTLLRVLAGLDEPTAGEVTCPADVGCSFQTPSVYGDLTVAENLDAFGGLSDADGAWRATLVERLGLESVRDRPADTLSDGQAAALDLALALLGEPATLLLDEPLADLDAARRRAALSLLEAFRAPERTVVLSTHDVAALDALCDRLVVLFDGTVVLNERESALASAPSTAVAEGVEAALERQ